MEKFKNKYRITSTRLQNWDYRWDGAYFITICTHKQLNFFGSIIKNNDSEQHMRLSNIGIIADIFWHEIKNHSTNVELGEFIVMPNHIHGILILTGNTDDVVETGNADDVVETGNADVDVETGHALSLHQPNLHSQQQQQQQQQQQSQTTKTIGQKRFQNIGKNSISSIIGSYKSAVSKHAHRLGYDFQWQSRFYEHIIRENHSYDRITKYIVNNPAQWDKDEFFIK